MEVDKGQATAEPSCVWMEWKLVCIPWHWRQHYRSSQKQSTLEIERKAECKSEYFEGEMFAMAGGTLQHSLIQANAIREVGNRLKGKPCTVYTADLRLKIEPTGLFTYPDLSVVCESPRFAEGPGDTVVNPTAIVEVLSDSTEAYDRGTKFEHYRQIATLKDYLLISQKEPRIDKFSRGPGESWLLTESVGLDKTLEIGSLGIAIELAEIFAHVSFPARSIR